MRSTHREIKAVARNWEQEVFGELHHEDFLFIRQTELLTRDEQVDKIDRLVRKKNFFKSFKPQLIHGSEFNAEGRWEDNGEIIAHVFLMR